MSSVHKLPAHCLLDDMSKLPNRVDKGSTIITVIYTLLEGQSEEWLSTPSLETTCLYNAQATKSLQVHETCSVDAGLTRSTSDTYLS